MSLLRYDMSAFSIVIFCHDDAMPLRHYHAIRALMPRVMRLYARVIRAARLRHERARMLHYCLLLLFRCCRRV